MFDIGWSEIALVGVIALVVIGPKELPQVLRSFGRFVRRMRNMTHQMQGRFDELMREADLEDVSNHIKKTRHISPVTQFTQALDKTVDPDGSLARELRQTPADLMRPQQSFTPPASSVNIETSPLALKSGKGSLDASLDPFGSVTRSLAPSGQMADMTLKQRQTDQGQ